MNESPTRFPYRIERWEKDAVHHVAGVEDFLLAMATYQAACRRWPDARITLRRVANSSRTAAILSRDEADVLKKAKPMKIPYGLRRYSRHRGLRRGR